MIRQKQIRVQKTTAEIFRTSEYIVLTIMENAVKRGFDKRGEITDFVSIKYNVLKNAENRTEKQKEIFAQLDASNLKTAGVWHIKEDFKTLFLPEAKENVEELFIEWMNKARSLGNRFLNQVVNTFSNHSKGVLNAFVTNTNSGKHENMNGKIQSVIAKARGFINFERFRINVLFYFSNLERLPLKT